MAYISQITLPDGTTYDLKASIGSSLTLEEITLTDTVSQLGNVESYLSKNYFCVKSGSTPPAFEVDGRTNMNITANLPINLPTQTASKILVTDSDKNIVSSSYEFDISTNNTSDTWLLVMNNNKIQHRVSTNLSVNYATSAGSAGIATDKIYGRYTAGGGQQGPSYFGKNYCGFLMSNAIVNNNSEFKNWLYMDCYDENDVGGTTAIGLSRQSTRAFLMRSNADRASWAGGCELLSTANYSSYALPLSGGTLTGSVNISGNYYYKVNNRVAVGDLGGSNFIACGNSGVYARRYDSTNTYAPMYASSFSQQSTKLVKENVNPITDKEAKKLLDIDVVSFDYIKEVGGEKGQVGMIAEDILDIYPNVVQIPNDYDEEQAKENIKNGNNMGTLGLDYAKFTPYLIKLVQMQQQQINELKNLIKTEE